MYVCVYVMYALYSFDSPIRPQEIHSHEYNFWIRAYLFQEIAWNMDDNSFLASVFPHIEAWWHHIYYNSNSDDKTIL